MEIGQVVDLPVDLDSLAGTLNTAALRCQGIAA